MEDTTVVVFDTTLRDGEQAPGFSMRIDEKLRLARQLDDLGVDIIEAGFPIASEADAESVRRVSSEIRRPVIAALARCAPGDIDAAGKALEPADREAHSHLHRHLRPASRAQAAHDAPAVSRQRGGGGDARVRLHRRRSVLGRGRDAQRPRLPLSGRRSGDRRGRDDGEPAGYGGVLHARTRSPSSSRRFSGACRTRRRPCSAPTATTISGSPSPTALPRSAPARARWSARSTASASARATPRSRRS